MGYKKYKKKASAAQAKVQLSKTKELIVQTLKELCNIVQQTYNVLVLSCVQKHAWDQELKYV